MTPTTLLHLIKIGESTSGALTEGADCRTSAASQNQSVISSKLGLAIDFPEVIALI